MHKKLRLCLVLLLVIPGLLFTTSCAKKTVKSETAAKEDAAKAAEAEAARQAELERQRKLQEERLKAERMKSMGGKGGQAQFEQAMIYFDFDRSNLSMEAQNILKQQAAFLKANPNAKAIIEGHCDERGTEEYNLALGDRRATSAKKYLVNLGIADARLKTVSYGEERPIDPRSNEQAWAKNRNCQFKLQ